MNYLKIKVSELVGKLELKTPASQLTVQMEKPEKKEPKLKVVKDESQAQK